MFKFKNGMFFMIFLSAMVFLLLSIVSVYAQDVSEKSLLVYSGAGLRKPMDEIGKVFEEKFGVKIDYTYAGSAQNLSQLQLVGEGDVYIPGDLYYYEQAKEKGLTIYEKDIAYHIPVIAVPKGNPAGIKSLDDLCRNDVEIVLGDEKAAAIGKVSQKILTNNNIAEEVNKNVVAKTATVNELVVYIAMKQADGAIIWEDNVNGVEDIEIVRIPNEKNEIKTIPVCVLSFTDKKELAIQFADFVASETGKGIFEKHGFKPLPVPVNS